MTTMDYDDEIAIGDLLARAPAPSGPFAWLRRLMEWRRQKRLQRITAYELSHLDRHLLRDIGIEPDDVEAAFNGRRSSVLFNPVRAPNRND